jgi:hypothetical protein
MMNSFLSWLGARWRASGEADEEYRPDLLDQFYSTLHVIALAARSHGPSEGTNTEVDAKLRQLFEEPPSWRGAYEIEQLLSLVMTEEQLNTELERRLEEARQLKLTYVGTLEKQWGAATSPASENNVSLKRALLQRLLNDLQWFYFQRIQRRSASKKLGLRVSAMFLSAFLFFFLVISIQFLAHQQMRADSDLAKPPSRDQAKLSE